MYLIHCYAYLTMENLRKFNQFRPIIEFDPLQSKYGYRVQSSVSVLRIFANKETMLYSVRFAKAQKDVPSSSLQKPQCWLPVYAK